MRMKENAFISALSSSALNLRYEELSPESIISIKRAFLDRLGCCIGAWRISPRIEFVESIQRLGGKLEATILGSGSQTSAHYAALINGTISSHLDYHSGPEMIPAALAVAEAKGCSGKELILAMATGFGVAGWLINVLASGVENHGLHWPGQLSPFSATIASCKLAGADDGAMARALSLAGTLIPIAPFEAFVQGAEVKNLYGGWGNMIGVLAARLGQLGFAGPESLIEGRMGLGQALLHSQGGIEAPPVSLGAYVHRIAKDLTQKAYACCTAAQPTLYALEKLHARYPDMDPDDIETVQVETYEYAVRISQQSTTDKPIGAKVNIPFISAAMIRFGEFLPEHTEEPHLHDPELRRLAGKVQITEISDSKRDRNSRKRPATITIVRRNGERLTSRVEGPKWSGSSKASNADLEVKFMRLVRGQMAESTIRRTMEMVWDLENISNVHEIISCLHQRAPGN